MPAVHHQTFQARYYECDAFGYLRNISYLRWMQEAAFAASAAVGYDSTAYHHLGQLWLVRESTVEHLAPLKYGDEVALTTYVRDIRRFRSIRAYELRNTQTGKLATRAMTDWVYLDAETLRPVTIPPEMQTAFFPEGVPEASLRRGRFPDYPVDGHAITTIQQVVGWDDLDAMWHVNNAAYLHYMDTAEKQALSEKGWSMERMHERGVCILPEQQRIEYLQPAVLGDALEIGTWCADGKRDTAMRLFEIRRQGEELLLVRAYVRWGLADVSTGTRVPLPGELR